ncbi:unnamed protein product [Caretta caretta]
MMTGPRENVVEPKLQPTLKQNLMHSLFRAVAYWIASGIQTQEANRVIQPNWFREKKARQITVVISEIVGGDGMQR